METVQETVQEKIHIDTVGRRKTSIARVFIKNGTGQITVNRLPLQVYFPRAILRKEISIPLEVTNKEKDYDIEAALSGGGKTGQAEALRHAIARALLKLDPKNHDALKVGSLLTRDPRMKERKKYGHSGARRRFQFSKR